MNSVIFVKYMLLPNTDDHNSMILLGEDDSRKIIKVVDGKLVIEDVTPKNKEIKEGERDDTFSE